MDTQKVLNIIDATPLVSVDLIIENRLKQILLGKRVNRPAQGYWFVPGGRILKNETIKDAIKRISTIIPRCSAPANTFTKTISSMNLASTRTTSCWRLLLKWNRISKSHPMSNTTK